MFNLIKCLETTFPICCVCHNTIEDAINRACGNVFCHQYVSECLTIGYNDGSFIIENFQIRGIAKVLPNNEWYGVATSMVVQYIHLLLGNTICCLCLVTLGAWSSLCVAYLVANSLWCPGLDSQFLMQLMTWNC